MCSVQEKRSQRAMEHEDGVEHEDEFTIYHDHFIDQIVVLLLLLLLLLYVEKSS